MQEPDNTLYPHINNDIEYGLFEDVINSYYLDNQIKDDFNCNQECYTDIQQTQQCLKLYKIQTPFPKVNQNLQHQWEFICKIIINIETSLAILTYNITTLIMVMHSLSKTSTALLQQESQNPYWCLHDPIMTKSYQISSEMDIKTMPHAM